MFNFEKLCNYGLLKSLSTYILKPSRLTPCFVSASHYSTFYQDSPREKYSKEDEFWKRPKKEILLEGFQVLKEEIKMWKDEVKEHLESDPVIGREPNQVDMFLTFNSSEMLKEYKVTCDSDHLEGHSSASLVITPNETGLFSGNLSTRLPLDGQIKKAGYTNFCSKRKLKSFKRDSFYDFTGYTHLVFKVRGDGRTYMINLHCPGSFDIFWNDIFQHVLYTRGGPYWQITKIPFSKFFLGAKGRIQDSQYAVPQTRISHLGITAADGIDGPFSLEIDYIGLEYDPNHKEEFAYEMYEVGKYVGST